MLRMMRLQRKADLLEVVTARGLTSRFARGLDRRQKKCSEYADDRHDNQQFNERESRPAMLLSR
jgi:hypothetical protein